MADTALVTGASGGIGEELAKLIAAGGANVVLVARNASKLIPLARELEQRYKVTATTVALDLAKRDAADELVRQIEAQGLRIDILVNNAGFGTSGRFHEIDAQQDLQLLDLNVVTLTMLTKRLLPLMVQRRHGRVLNVASTAAFQAGPLMAVYYASKAYVLSFSEALSQETRGTGVTVTCLCPGPTRTGFQRRAGLERARLFASGLVMTPTAVARAGYDGMVRGKAVVVPGIANKVGVQSLRIVPRALVRRLVERLQTDV